MHPPFPPLPQAAAPLFVVSPHLDDAVFSCGELLASRPGSIVCTVFCGEPAPPQRTSWDQFAGHCDSSVAIRSRMAEDERALAIVGARAVRLSFLDSQYREGVSPPTVDIAHALMHAWLQHGGAPLIAPLGLYHADHILVGDACRLLARRQRLSHLVVYEEAPYRRMKHVASARLAALAREGCRCGPIDKEAGASLRRPGSANAKWRAVHAYRSQLRAFGDAHPYDLREPERYLHLVIDPPQRRRSSVPP